MSGDKLLKACQKIKRGTSPGADGWKVSELRMLPLAIFKRLADVLNVIEEARILNSQSDDPG